MVNTSATQNAALVYSIHAIDRLRRVNNNYTFEKVGVHTGMPS
jgi:hypothetical protein